MFRLLVLCTVIIGSLGSPVDERIVGGTKAKVGEIPYIVSVRIFGFHSCGGSIIDATHVLTAAHCIIINSPSAYSIQYGVLTINNKDNIIDVTQLVKHPDYQIGYGFPNDVAVLTLAKPIVFSDTVKKTVLPTQGAATPGDSPAVLAGWGYEMSGGSVQEDLLRVDIICYTDENCSKAHGSKVNSTQHVCAGVPEGGKGQCSADSGGPLYANGVQIGVVSWSEKPCTVKGYPGVFAKVSNYVNWILAQTK